MPIKQNTLSNNLHIIIDKKDINSFAIQVTVHTGSNFENPKIAGISHFIEHLIFEGTKTRSAKEIAESIEKTGGDFNAFTTNEYTAFHIKVPKKHKKLAIEILYDIVHNSVFEPKRIEKERKVILEEIKMSHDDPGSAQWHFFVEKLFGKHPAAIPVAGFEKTVKATTRKDILNYYHKYYVPSNMVLTAVGNVNMKDFEVFKKLKDKKIKHSTYPVCKNTKSSSNKKKPISQTYHVRGWVVPGYNHKDRFALEILSSILSKGLSGRLVEKLRNENGLAYTTGAAFEAKSTYGIFALYITCTKKNLGQVKKLMDLVLESLSDIPKKEFNEAKNYLIGKAQLDEEDTLERCDDLAESYLMKIPNLDNNYSKHIKSVSETEVQRVIKKYLSQGATEISING